MGSNIARIYGTPKIHKIDNNITDINVILSKLKLRPIISSIGTYNYNLAKYLSDKLIPHIPSTYSVNDTFTFVKDLNELSYKDKYLTSFDVVSLFTNIPLYETIELAVDIIKSKYPDLKITRNELTQLFRFATAETHFLYEGKIYDQIEGVAMGSPIAPVLANLFMGYHEHNWLSKSDGKKPIVYKRYVDDVFCLFDNEIDAKEFLEYLNKQHPNIKFTSEPELNGVLPFLDISIEKRDGGGFVTSVYHKSSYTGLLLNYLSFTPNLYKKSLVKTLINRTYRICSNWNNFSIDVNKLKHVLQRNGFPLKFIERIIRNYLDKTHEVNNNTDTVIKTTHYYKLPYIGDVSDNSRAKIRSLCKLFCKNLDIKLSFNTCKVSSYFSTKSKSPSYLQSHVVYYFKCNSCASNYVGMTTRHCSVRIDEHLGKDKASHIYKHLNANDNCKQSNDDKSFKIIDRASTKYTIGLKESLHIKWLKPTINSQKYHINLTLTV